MTSIDDLFKNAGSSSKRKLDAVRDPSEIYKTVKLSANDRNSRHDRVANDKEDDDMDAGPMPPPDEGDGGDYGPEEPPDEDDEGRFFGGGVSKEQARALDFVAAQDDDAAAPVEIDSAWLRKTALSFEKLINKNAELRAKYEQDPQKFINSEADLDAAIKDLSILSEHTDLWPELVKLGTVGSLVGLLAHDNTDIAITAVQVISELTDEDVESTDDDWNKLVDALLEADLISLLVSNLGRLDESDETDASGVYHALTVVENIMSRPAVAESVGLDDALLRWLLGRVQRKAEDGARAAVMQNRQYSAELLAIISQVSTSTRRKLIEMDVIDIMLQLIAPYRRRDPEKGGVEEEYVQNLFEALVALVDEPEGKAKLVEAEGVELCVLMLRDSGSKLNKLPTVRLLNHASSGFSAGLVCQKLVEAGGLKPIFSLFTKRNDHRVYVDLLIGIFSWMLQLLPADSAERIRTQAKFVEKEYQKTVQLVAIRRRFVELVNAAEAESRRKWERMDDSDREGLVEEDYVLLDKVDAGLYTLQYVDTILAWLAAEDRGCRGKIRELLAEQGKSLDDVKATLKAQLDRISPEGPESKEWQEMLSALIHAM